MKETASSLTKFGKVAIIVAAFLGWFFAGMHLGITSLAPAHDVPGGHMESPPGQIGAGSVSPDGVVG